MKFLGCDWASSHFAIQRDEVQLARLRIGHTHLTHSYLLQQFPCLFEPPAVLRSLFATCWSRALTMTMQVAFRHDYNTREQPLRSLPCRVIILGGKR